MKAENHSERRIEIDGWPVRLTSYRIGDTFHCTADNVSPGAAIARCSGLSAREAEENAMARAKELLQGTRRRAV